MKEPKVSIITVCLNSVKTLEQTIQSVINQSYQNIEYIIVDGASTDGTLDIIRKYEKRITKWISEKDQGIYDAMNKGLDMASGDIVGIINSDDWYELNAVETVVQAFDEETEVVYGTVANVYADKYSCVMKNRPLEQLVYRMVMCHEAVFVKREVYQRIGKFDVRYWMAADYELLLRMYLNDVRMKPIEDVLVYFRIGGASDVNGVVVAEEFRKAARHYAEQKNDTETLKKIEEYYTIRVSNAWAKKRAYAILNNEKDRAVKWLWNWMYDKREVQIYGAGGWGIECFIFLGELGVNVEGFLDGDTKKQSTFFLGKPVRKCCGNNRMNAEGQTYIIVAAMNYEEEIVKMLVDMGYQREKDFCLYSELVEKMYCEINREAVV